MGTTGVQHGHNRGTTGVQHGYNMGTTWVQHGYNMGYNMGYNRGTTWVQHVLTFFVRPGHFRQQLQRRGITGFLFLVVAVVQGAVDGLPTVC
jgi:hypothetical protein